MDALPAFYDQMLPAFLNTYHDFKNQQPTPNNPDPDLQAACFALTGWTPDDQHLHVVNTMRDSMGQNGPLPYICRDFDSLIGFMERLPVLSDISYYPNPNLKYTLMKNIHVTHFTEMRMDEGVSVPILQFYTQTHCVSILLFLFCHRVSTILGCLLSLLMGCHASHLFWNALSFNNVCRTLLMGCCAAHLASCHFSCFSCCSWAAGLPVSLVTHIF